MPLPFGPVPGKSLLRRDLDQRVPVVRRVDLRGGARVRRDDRRERRRRPASRGPRRIDEAVAAHPDHVGGPCRQVGQQIPALVVGDHDLAELRRRVIGLGDDPDAGLGPRALVTTPAMSSASIGIWLMSVSRVGVCARSHRDALPARTSASNVIETGRRVMAGISLRRSARRSQESSATPGPARRGTDTTAERVVDAGGDPKAKPVLSGSWRPEATGDSASSRPWLLNPT